MSGLENNDMMLGTEVDSECIKQSNLAAAWAIFIKRHPLPSPTDRLGTHVWALAAHDAVVVYTVLPVPPASAPSSKGKAAAAVQVAAPRISVSYKLAIATLAMSMQDALKAAGYVNFSQHHNTPSEVLEDLKTQVHLPTADDLLTIHTAGSFVTTSDVAALEQACKALALVGVDAVAVITALRRVVGGWSQQLYLSTLAAAEGAKSTPADYLARVRTAVIEGAKDQVRYQVAQQYGRFMGVTSAAAAAAQPSPTQTAVVCQFCGKIGHTAAKCWLLNKKLPEDERTGPTGPRGGRGGRGAGQGGRGFQRSGRGGSSGGQAVAAVGGAVESPTGIISAAHQHSADAAATQPGATPNLVGSQVSASTRIGQGGVQNVAALTTGAVSGALRPHIVVQFADKYHSLALIDSGSACTLVSNRLARTIGCRVSTDTLSAGTGGIRSVSGTTLDLVGVVERLDIKHANGAVMQVVNVVVVADHHWGESAQFLIGMDTLRRWSASVTLLPPNTSGRYALTVSGQVIAECVENCCSALMNAAKVAIVFEEPSAREPGVLSSAVVQDQQQQLKLETVYKEAGCDVQTIRFSSAQGDELGLAGVTDSGDDGEEQLQDESAAAFPEVKLLSKEEAMAVARSNICKIHAKIDAAARDPRASAWSAADIQALKNVYSCHAELFQPLSKTALTPDENSGKPPVPALFVIKLVDECAPLPNVAHRNYAVDVMAALTKTIKELLEAGVIQHSEGAAANPLVVVRKKNGALRICQDLRLLNSNTVARAHSVPNIDALVARMAGQQFYYTLDLASFFFQIECDAATSDLLGFSVPEIGQFKFVRMPQGAKTAPAHAQQLADQVWTASTGAPGVKCAYVDDRCGGAMTPQDFIAATRADLAALNQYNRPLLLSADKVNPLTFDAKILGFIVNSHGVRMDETRIEALLGMPPPTNVTEVQRLLGLANWMAQFVPNLAHITAPIRSLTTLPKGLQFVSSQSATKSNFKKTLVNWTPECEAAFAELKRQVAKRIELAAPRLDGSGELFVFTDASDFAVGSVVCRKVESYDHIKANELPEQLRGMMPIAFFSKCLTAVQKRWPTAQREAYAVVATLLRYQDWCHSVQVVHVFTDSSTAMGCLRSLVQHRQHRMQRWAALLHSFPSVVVHKISGSVNVIADMLSRIASTAATSLTLAAYTPSSTSATATAAVTASTADATLSAVTGQLQAIDAAVIGVAALRVEPLDIIRPLLTDKLPASPKEWAQAQRSDPQLNQIITYLENGTTPDPATDRQNYVRVTTASRQMLLTNDGVLLFADRPRAAVRERLPGVLPLVKLVVPDHLQEAVIKLFHDDPIHGGHRGFNESYGRLAQRFIWEGSYAQMRKYVRDCMDCAQSKASSPPANPETEPIPAPTRPFQVMHIDYLKVATSNKGNNYLLVFICALTGWIEIVPALTCDAATVVDALLLHVWARLLYLPEIISDRGSHFTAEEVRTIVRILGSVQHFTAAYNPRANGQVERMNRTIITALKIIVHNIPAAWDEAQVLASVLANVRGSVRCAAAGLAPVELVYGFARRLPLDVVIEKVVTADHPLNNVKADVKLATKKRMDIMADIYVETKQALDRAHQDAYSSQERTALDKFVLSDYVWVYFPIVDVGEANKLARRFQGPFSVVMTDVNSNKNTYKVQHYKNKSWTITVHGDRLLRCTAPPNDIDQPDVYEISEIVSQPDDEHLVVRWKGFDAAKTTVLDVEEVRRAAPLLLAAWARRDRRSKSRVDYAVLSGQKKQVD